MNRSVISASFLPEDDGQTRLECKVLFHSFLLAAAFVGLLEPVGSSAEVVAGLVVGSRGAEEVTGWDITGSKGLRGGGGRGGVHTHDGQDGHNGKSDSNASVEHGELTVVVVGVEDEEGEFGDGVWNKDRDQGEVFIAVQTTARERNMLVERVSQSILEVYYLVTNAKSRHIHVPFLRHVWCSIAPRRIVNVDSPTLNSRQRSTNCTYVHKYLRFHTEPEPGDCRKRLLPALDMLLTMGLYTVLATWSLAK